MTARELWDGLTRTRGNRTWDGVVRGTGLVGLLAIPLVTLYPETGPLTGFLLVTIWVNGPIAPFLPATYEPILMIFGRLYPPVLIATIGIVGTIYVEFLNYHLYRKILELDAAEGLREHRTTRKVVDLFERMPFFTVWLCSWSILPYWSVRFLSPLAGYPVGKQMLATFLGRFPRLWFFAALGVWWDIDTRWLVWATFGGIALGLGVWLYRRVRGKSAARRPTTGTPAAMAEPDADSSSEGRSSGEPSTPARRPGG